MSFDHFTKTTAKFTALLTAGVAAIALAIDKRTVMTLLVQPIPRWQFVAGVGMACAVTALPILILLMEKLGILRQPLGQRGQDDTRLDEHVGRVAGFACALTSARVSIASTLAARTTL